MATEARCLQIGNRKIGEDYAPFIIAEIGINHAGSFELAKKMVHAAWENNADCVKFQTHCEDEFGDTPAYPENAGGESIQNLILRCSLVEEHEAELKAYAESLGMIYLSTPFSRMAVDRLERLGVKAYKIGSGHAADSEFVRHVASKGKPIILSTGMSTMAEIYKSVEAIESEGVPYALLACTSMYPTEHKDVRLGTIRQLKMLFPRAAAIGLSCHSRGIWTALGAVALGASIVEKHFKIGDCPDGPDLSVSIDRRQLLDLWRGAYAIWEASGGSKDILPGEQKTRDWFKASRRV